MSELTKTTICFVAALAAVGLAMFSRPSTSDFNVQELVGQLIYSEGDIPLDAPKRMRVTQMDEETGQDKVFEVAEVDGTWSIPSKSGYPADATQHMSDAVEGVVGLEVLDVSDATAETHAEYGVVDPEDPKASNGYGTRVQLSDGDNKKLADLIIGKQIEGSDGQYYVRKAGEDPVYHVAIDLDKFSTDFDDWIEKDLLDLSPFDIRRVTIDDYQSQVVSTPQGPGLAMDRKAKMTLEYDDEASEWKPVSLQAFDNEKRAYEPFELADDEELNKDTLRELKNAFDDLTIVDVMKKPEGLSADLQAGEAFLNNREAQMSLIQTGFYPGEGGTIISTEGEIRCILKNGVEYILRFGDLQFTEQEAVDTDADKSDEEKSEEGLNRYMFVMAEFNQGAIDKPELEPLPELPAEDEAADEEASETSSEEGEQAEEPAAKPTKEDVEAQRKIVEEANQTKQKEYEEKIEEGKKRVTELNERFGDWYYVIPNDVFKKIHLSREDVIAKKEGAEGDADQPPGGPAGLLPNLPNLNLPGVSQPQPPAAEESKEEPASETPATEEPASEPAESTEPTEETPAGEESASTEPEATEPETSEPENN